MNQKGSKTLSSLVAATESDHKLLLQVIGEESDASNKPLSLDEFMDIVRIKCKFCPNFVCDSKSALLQHVTKHHQPKMNRAILPKMSTQSPTSSSRILDVSIQVASCNTASDQIRYVTETLTSSNQNDDVILCGVCSNAFTSNEECNDHMVKVHGLGIPSSYEGQEALETEQHVNDYVVTMVNPIAIPEEARIRCQVKGCGYSFKDDELLIHKGCHLPENPKRFKCLKCSQVFENWTSCCAHLWTKHSTDAGLYKCRLCNEFRTTTQSKLDVHMLIHSEERQFGCSVCHKRFKQLSQLKNHSVIHIDRAKKTLPLWYFTKRQCNICSKFLTDSKSLKKHIQTVHGKLKPYICQVCNHQSSRKTMLKLHMRQHTGEKPFMCNICAYKTGDHNSLRRHKMRHTGQKPYKCNLCDYSSVQCDSFKRHVQIKHPNHDSSASGVYSCLQCPFKTVKAESYFSHLKNHENDNKLKEATEELTSSTTTEPETTAIDKPKTKPRIIKKSLDYSQRKKIAVKGKSTVKKAEKLHHPEEEDSLHAAPTDHGGTTIPA